MAMVEIWPRARPQVEPIGRTVGTRKFPLLAVESIGKLRVGDQLVADPKRIKVLVITSGPLIYRRDALADGSLRVPSLLEVGRHLLTLFALAEAPVDVLLHFLIGLPTRGQGSGGVAHLVPQITPLVANSNDMLSRFAFPVDRDVFSFRVKTKLADPVLGERLR